MLNSIRAGVRYLEVVRYLEGPLWEAPLYIGTHLELLSHHMTISQLKYQTSVDNKYALNTRNWFEQLRIGCF